MIMIMINDISGIRKISNEPILKTNLRTNIPILCSRLSRYNITKLFNELLDFTRELCILTPDAGGVDSSNNDSVTTADINNNWWRLLLHYLCDNHAFPSTDNTTPSTDNSTPSTDHSSKDYHDHKKCSSIYQNNLSQLLYTKNSPFLVWYRDTR